jgi:hypothetical protein
MRLMLDSFVLLGILLFVHYSDAIAEKPMKNAEITKKVREHAEAAGFTAFFLTTLF